ncbi:MAG: DNA polymerase, partial [Bacteroidota bacterium]
EPVNLHGYQLLHEGALALSQVSQNGIVVDVEYCKRKSKFLGRKMDREIEKLKRTELGETWLELFSEPKWATGDAQLREVLFGKNGFQIEPIKFTEKTKYKKNPTPATDAEALEQIDLDGIDELRRIKKWQQTRATFLAGIIREAVRGVLHPFFSLHTVQTFRSSSQNPNWQNVPVRDPEIGKLIRQAVHPRKGRLLVEIDFSGVEVRVAACYHKDPVMIADITDPDRDMHRDLAQEAYILTLEEMGAKGGKGYKLIRYSGKNGFVFPQFYGDFYRNNAKAMWHNIDSLDLHRADGTDLKTHLRSHGIKNYLDFEEHIKKVENWFWKEKYPVYNTWGENWYATYRERGWLEMLTGFRCSGLMRRNQVINYPVQGAAFHCLLWSLIHLQKWLKANHMKSLIIGQIHDSIILDIHPDEYDAVLSMAYRIMEQKIREVWKWIILPLEVEAEVSPIGASWNLKKEITRNVPPCKCGTQHLYKLPVKDQEGSITGWRTECPICRETRDL